MPGSSSRPGQDRDQRGPRRLTIIHEASHAWFNSDLFDGRWITRAGRTRSRPGPSTAWRRRLGARGRDPTDPAAVRLDSWEHPGRITDTETEARAIRLQRRVDGGPGDRHGDRLDAMQDVLAPPSRTRSRTSGRAPRRRSAAVSDWRRLLDLLDETGHSTRSDDLFRRLGRDGRRSSSSTSGRRPERPTRRLVQAGGNWQCRSPCAAR